MQRLQAFKYELIPTGEQLRNMRRFAGSCRFVFNKALALQKENYGRGLKHLSYVELARELTAWRHSTEDPWIKDAPCSSQQHALKYLDQAYRRFFAKQAAYPKFKKKGARESFHYPNKAAIRLDQEHSRILLPKLGWVRYRNSRAVIGELRNATVSLTADKWFVSIQTARDVERPTPQSTSAVGIDVGIARFATMSDGTFLAPLHSLKRHQAKLRRAQHQLSRKTKFSRNWRKAKTRVQRIHVHIANARRDFLHKATTTISKNHAMVCIEDLKVGNMSRSSSGNATRPGRCVRAKSGLNKAILDQGWFEFRRQLEYKLAWNGGLLVAVSPANTSSTCPACSHVSTDNRKTQAEFSCVSCGHQDHADIVGALNVLARGHRVAACGEPVQSGHSTKQEPTEAIQADSIG
ncbi:putative transposase [Cupriavidus sp. YR651]|uniref:RNA-guided endonuclease InsQ/TnpB family protein n=1 Tax=Cupriavidus sp. YR651 TaxID=1855315 RepID=UPI0008859D00|nr:RNA-guided endonuclease TnpB family protein [Cupriavidus sp. YR651]SDD57559.1 putative transposase [Cupriavidus sp. YR651]